MDESPQPRAASAEHTAADDGVRGYNPQARLEYLQTILPPKKNRRWLKWLIGLAVLALAGLGVFWLFAGRATAPAKTPATTHPKPAPASTQTAPLTTQHYESTAFNLNLDYPSAWTIDDKNSDKLAIISPKLQLATAAGKTVPGKVSITITPSGKNLAGFDQGNGTAVRDSLKVKYKQPTPAQRAETYLTFVRFANTAVPGLDTVIITGDFGYLTGQAVPQVDMSKLGLVIQTTFQQCNDTACVSPIPVVVSASAWDNPAIQKPVLTTLESLSVN